MITLNTVKIFVQAAYNALGLVRYARILSANAPMNPAKMLSERANSAPDSSAILFENRRYTWKEVDEWASRYAGYFEASGIGTGDTVALIMDNRPEYLFAIMGLSRLRAITALVNTNLTGAALTHAIGAVSPKKVLAGVEHAARVSQIIGNFPALNPDTDFLIHDDRIETAKSNFGTVINEAIGSRSPKFKATSPELQDVFCYIYTSGTTGLPKAAVITNHRMLAAGLIVGKIALETKLGDVTYVALPLYHSNGMMIGWGSVLTTGSTLAIRRKFSASEFWRDIRQFRATVFIYIGELCRYLLNTTQHPDETEHRLRLCFGNGMRPEVWVPFQKRFRIPLVREFYGATESNTGNFNIEGRPGMIGRRMPGQAIVHCDPESGEVRRGSNGLCQPVKPGETGLLLGRINPLIPFQGYLDKESTNQKIIHDVLEPGDQYFNTGDLICLHTGGWLSFGDRLGDTYRWKGENVSTMEVASIIGNFQSVTECVVYGVSVPGMEGQAGMAAIRVQEQSFNLQSFSKFIGQNLASYQRPMFVRLLSNDIKITGTFKHQKREYRDEGYDPNRVRDPLYILAKDQYEPIDTERFGRIPSGAIG